MLKSLKSIALATIVSASQEFNDRDTDRQLEDEVVVGEDATESTDSSGEAAGEPATIDSTDADGTVADGTVVDETTTDTAAGGTAEPVVVDDAAAGDTAEPVSTPRPLSCLDLT